jgi:hypothetical protein
MVQEEDELRVVSAGRARAAGATRPFTRRVVREPARRSGPRGRRGAAAAGGGRIDGAGGADRLSEHRSSGRFSGRGRKAAAALPRENDWSAPEGGGDTPPQPPRRRQVGVVKLKGRTSRAADARSTHNERLDGRRRVPSKFVCSMFGREAC